MVEAHAIHPPIMSRRARLGGRMQRKTVCCCRGVGAALPNVDYLVVGGIYVGLAAVRRSMCCFFKLGCKSTKSWPYGAHGCHEGCEGEDVGSESVHWWLSSG